MSMRLGRRIWLGVAIAVALAVAAVSAVVIVRFSVGSQGLARDLAAALNLHAVDGATTRVRIADLAGNPLTRLELRGVEVEVKSGEAWVPFLTARRIEAVYRPVDLARGRYRLRVLRLVEPHITVVRGGPLPRLKVRAVAGGEPSTEELDGGGAGGFGLLVDRLIIENAKVDLDTLEADLSLAGRLEVGGDRAAIGIDSLAVQAGRHPRVVLAGGAVMRGDAIELAELSFDTGRTRVVLNGVLEGTRSARLKITLDPVDLADARGIAGTSLLGAEGWVRGTADIEGPWQDLMLELALAARVGDDVIEDLRGRGRVRGQVVEIEDLALELNGVPFSGSGRVGLGPRRADSSGRLEFEEVDLREFPWLRNQSWMPVGTLSGVLQVGAESRGPAGRERPFDLAVSRGTVRGLLIAPGRFRGALEAGGRIRLDAYEVTTRGGAVTGVGGIDPHGEMALEQELSIDDLSALAGMLGERRFGGRGRLGLRLAGPVRAPTFSGEGEFDSLAGAGAQLTGARVEFLNGAFRPAFGFVFDLEAAGGVLGGVPIDSLALAGTYQGGRLGIRHFTAGRGESAIRAAGEATFSRGDVVIDVTELTATARQERWESPSRVRFSRRGSVWTIDGLNLTGSLGAFSLAGAIEPGGPATRLDAHLVDVDLAGLGALLGREGFAGKVELSLKASGGGDESRLEFHATGDSLRLRGFDAEHLEVIGSIHGETITISRLVLDRGGKIEVAGDVRFARPLGGFSALKLLAEPGTWKGAVVDLGVRAPSLDLAAWRGIHRELDRWQGTVDLTLTLAGRPESPDGTITLRSDKLRWNGEELAPLSASARLSAGALAFDDLKLTLAGSPLAVRGATPVRLSLIKPPGFDREQPLALAVDLNESDLAVARFVTDRVVDAGGALSGSIEIGGTLAAPLIRGTVAVSDGQLRLHGREETLVGLSGQIEFTGDRAQFANVEGGDGGEGRLKASGVLTLRDGHLAGYDVTAVLQRFEVGVSGEYAAVLDGDFRLRRSETGGVPEYTGTVLVHKLDYLREVGGDDEEPGPSGWVGRFDIELPGKAWIRNTDLEVELRGQIVYERDVSGRTMLGRLETIRGRYNLFGHTFRITSGEILFTDPNRIDPELSVTGETRIPEALIFATITGRASDRQVVLSSDPDYDQASLWKMLVPSGAGEVTGLVSMTPFVTDLEQTIFREVPGLSVSIEERAGAVGAAPILGVRAGTYVGSELFFSAYQGFAASGEQDISLEYGLGRRVFLKGSAVRRGFTEGSQPLDEGYNLDLNLRWEF